MSNFKIQFKYLVPNLFTALCLTSGVFAIYYILNENYTIASLLVALSMLCDGLDGKLARLLNASSKFGSFFDTISDYIAFGIVPAFLSYMAVIHKFSPLAIFVIILYLGCGAYRLTRFMKKTVTLDKKKPFIGLPIPTAAGMIASYILLTDKLGKTGGPPVLLVSIILFISFLMVSHIQYLPLELKLKKITIQSGIFYLLAILSLIFSFQYYYLIFIFWIVLYIVYGLFRYFIISLK